MNFSIKVCLSIILLLLSQAVFSDNRQGDGRRKFANPQRVSPHPVHKPHPAYQSRKPRKIARPKFSQRNHNYYRPGYSTRYLPYGSSRVIVGNRDYYFFDGYFYRPFQNKYHIVDAPIGAIVLSLPRLHFSLQWDGLNFFIAGNTYYRRHPKGYIVVRNPGFRDDWR